MIYLGAKLFGQDSSVFLLDQKNKKIFAVSSEKISGVKKDNYDISVILKDISFSKFKKEKIFELSYSFNNFEGKDAVLETKGTSYFWLKANYYLRKIIKVKYKNQKLRIKSLPFLNMLSKFHYIVLYHYYSAIRKYYFEKYISDRLKEGFHKYYIKKYIDFLISSNNLNVEKYNFHDHHETHAYSAYYFSDFVNENNTLIFTMDEHGDNFFSKVFIFNNSTKKTIASSKTFKYFIGKVGYAASIAGMYSNFTEAMDLKRSSDEGKVEALAAFGKPNNDLVNKLNNIFFLDEYFSIKINREKYINFSSIENLKKIRKELGDENFCSSIQFFLESFLVNYLKLIQKIHKFDNICLSGGIFANVILNFKLYEATNYKNIYIFPAMNDEGSAAGAAIMSALNNKENLDWLKNCKLPYFGPEFNNEEILNVLKSFNKKIKFNYINDMHQRAKICSELILENKVVGVFQGKTEFGPRALGNRSILANAANKNAIELLNDKIKKRKKYQPFCPVILEEDRKELFKNSYNHKHMAICFKMNEEFKNILPSATHIDLTARPQFIEKDDNEFIYLILKHIKEKIGFGVAINTSFNKHGNSMVSNPNQALDDFSSSNMDALIIGDYFVERNE